METFYVLKTFCEGNPADTGGFLAQRPVTRLIALMFPLVCAWPDGWVNNGDAGDLSRHRAHYSVTVMMQQYLFELVLTAPADYREKGLAKQAI